MLTLYLLIGTIAAGFMASAPEAREIHVIALVCTCLIVILTWPLALLGSYYNDK